MRLFTWRIDVNDFLFDLIVFDTLIELKHIELFIDHFLSLFVQLEKLFIIVRFDHTTTDEAFQEVETKLIM